MIFGSWIRALILEAGRTMRIHITSILLGLGVEVVFGMGIGAIFGAMIPALSPGLIPESALLQWAFAAAILCSAGIAGYVVANHSPTSKLYNSAIFGLLSGFTLVGGHLTAGPHLIELAAGDAVFALLGGILCLYLSVRPTFPKM